MVVLLQQVVQLLGGADIGVVTGADYDLPSDQWVDDVAIIDAFQAKNIRRGRKKARRKAEFEAWKRKSVDELLDG